MGCSVGLKYAKNALAVGALPRTPLPQDPRQLGRETPPPHPSAPRFSRLWRFDPRAPRWKPGAPRCFRAGYGPGWRGSPTMGFPWDDLHKIFIETSQMAKVPNGVETLQ